VEGATVALLGAPEGFADGIEGLPARVRLRARASGTADVVVSFHTDRSDLVRRAPALLRVLAVDGGLWIAWPKKASKVSTDITEDTVREVFLPLGLVDNKVCAIDEVWSGLRVVWRRELRGARRSRGTIRP
jgi:hypothetical protein